MKNAVLLFFMCFSGILYGQTDFRKGKIIQLNGDTISGELNYQGDISNSRFIRFRNQDIDSTFRPFEIKSYYFENGKSYVSKIAIIDSDTVRIFAEYLVSGKKDLFFNRSASGFHYLISANDSVIKNLPHKIELVNIDGVNYQKESRHFVGYLKSYFNDCPSIFPKIDQLQSPRRKSLISLTKEYHDITCGEGVCTIYDRKEYPIKIAIEPVYSLYTKRIHEYYVMSNATNGGHLFLWMPNSSERLYAKTGLHFALKGPYKYYQIPLQFEYVFPFKVIKPKFAIGVNAHFIGYPDVGYYGSLSTLVNGGFYVKLTDWMYLDLDISSDLFFFDNKTGVFESFATRTGLFFIVNKKNHR